MSELNLILIGPPGAGKGTQAERLQQDFGLPYLATGDMMRAAKEEDSDLGREIKGFVESGGLVPDEIVCKVLMARLDAEGDDGFILDGFPRTSGQADVLQGALEKRGRRLTAALLIEVPDETLIERLAGRRQCAKGHPYHVEYNPPKHEGVCDIDGTKLTQRDDDKPETIAKRLEIYHDQTEPLVERFDAEGLLRRFDGTRPPNEVHDHIRATLAVLRLEEGL
jgi:adenylate kinase